MPPGPTPAVCDLQPTDSGPRDSTGGHLDSALIFPRSLFPNLLQDNFHVQIAFEARELLSPLYQ